MRNLTRRARVWAWIKVVFGLLVILGAISSLWTVWDATGVHQWFRIVWALIMAVIVVIQAFLIAETVRG